MGIARRLEERLERLVDGVSAAFFRGSATRPVDLANRLVRYADLHVERTWVGPTIPNTYRLFVVDAESGNALSDPAAARALAAELAEVMRITAAESGWATSGPITVALEPGRPGARTTEVQATSQPGPMRPWGQLMAVRSAEAHDLGDNRVGIGRGEGVAVRIDVPEVSRHHAVIFRHEGRHWFHDAGSTNGTWRNGERVGIDPAPLAAGDTVRFGPIGFTFRTV